VISEVVAGAVHHLVEERHLVEELPAEVPERIEQCLCARLVRSA
jgi:hypothetical protein